MSRVQANLLLLLTALIWGMAFVAQQTGAEGVGPLTFNFLRFFLGGIVVLPLAIREYHIRRQSGLRFSRSDLAGLIMVGGFLFAGATLQQAGISSTTVTNAGFLTVLYVPLVPVLALVILRQTSHWSVWPAMVACVFGTYLLSGMSALVIGSGDFLMVLGAVFWAFHVLAISAVGQRTGAPVILACVQFFVVSAFSGVGVLGFETIDVASVWRAWPELVYTGCISAGLAFTIQVIAQRFTSAAEAAILLSSETLFAAIAGTWILEERLNLTQLTGAGMIFAAICAVQILPLFKTEDTMVEQNAMSQTVK